MATGFVYFSTCDYGRWDRESFIKNWEWNTCLGKIWAGKYYLIYFPPPNSLGSSLKLINHPLCPIYCHKAPDLLYCFNMKKTFHKSKPCLTHWPEVVELCSFIEVPIVWLSCGLGRSTVVSQLDSSLFSDADRGDSCECGVSFTPLFLSWARRPRFLPNILDILPFKVDNLPFLGASIFLLK